MFGLARYRRKIEILADVLSAARPGARKTRIMYVANLSYVLVNKYLKETMAIGFLVAENDEYRLTRRGQDFLDRYVNYRNRFGSIEKMFEVMRSEMRKLEAMCVRNNDMGLAPKAGLDDDFGNGVNGVNLNGKKRDF